MIKFTTWKVCSLKLLRLVLLIAIIGVGIFDEI